jgi:hypothetical protein
MIQDFRERMHDDPLCTPPAQQTARRFQQCAWSDRWNYAVIIQPIVKEFLSLADNQDSGTGPALSNRPARLLELE